MKVYPKDYKEKEGSNGSKLDIDTAKQVEMVGKVNELIGNTPKEFKTLCDELERFYVFERGEHYTSDQLKTIVEAVRISNQPVAKVVDVVEEFKEDPKVEIVVEDEEIEIVMEPK